MNIPQVRFSYLSDGYDHNKEIVCRKLIEAVGALIELPKEIILQFADLGDSVYGNTSIEFRFKNRIRLNCKLTTEEVPIPLVHELIHVNQVHLGLLSARSGVVFWRDKPYRLTENMSYAQHQSLPWEMDVTNRHTDLLRKALYHALAKGVSDKY